MAVYGPVRHQTNIIWTSEASVLIILFWWPTGPYTAIWPSVPWTISYIYSILSNYHNYQGNMVYGVSVMVSIARFNNISDIRWRSVLLVEETGVPEENHRPVTDKLYHILSRVHIAINGIRITTLVFIGTDCICIVRGGSRGRTRRAPPLKLEKIWFFFGVKSWFFTRNTPKFSRLPPLGAIFLSAPPQTWNPGSAPDSIIVVLVVYGT